MTTYAPAYRLTVYAPRSVDATEATILTPAAGSSHTDAFKVSTLTLAGWQAYLGLPQGRRGGIDPLTKRVSIGALTVLILDKRVGTSNAARWLTAFLGDSTGRNALLGCKAYLEESLDAGTTWSPFFVGRIKRASVDGLRGELAIADAAEDLNLECFADRPAASVTYAVEPQVLPPGLSGQYGPHLPPAPLDATMQTPPFAVPWRSLQLDPATAFRDDNVIVKALQDQAGSYVNPFRFQTGVHFDTDQVRIRFSATSPSITNKEAKVTSISGFVRSDGKLGVSGVDIEALDPTDLSYQAIDTGTIPDGTAITWTLRVTATNARTKRNRLYLDTVDLMTFLADLLDGKFSRLYKPGETRPAGKSIGDPVQTIPYDASGGTPWDALANPASTTNALPATRWGIDKPMKLFEFFEKHIGPVYGLSYRFEAALAAGQPVSRFVPVDMRLPTLTALGSVDTLDDTDLVTTPGPTWDHDQRSAVTKFLVRYYTDEVIPPAELANFPDQVPDIPPALINAVENTLVDVDFGRAIDLANRDLDIDALGIRGTFDVDDTTEGAQQRAWAYAEAKRVPELYRSQFGSGAMIVTFTTRRTARTSGLYQGDWVKLNATRLPNVSTRQRGGVRVVQILERSERGPVIEFEAIDGGIDTSTTAPTIGTPTQTGGYTTNSISAVVTLNGSSEPAVVGYAIKATSYGATPPGHNDPSWLTGPRVTATGTVRILNIPSGMRIFVRARTEPTPGPSGSGPTKLPSAWAVPAGTKYVDTAVLPTPTGVTHTPATVLTNSTVLVGWTNPSNAVGLPIRLTLGDTPDVVLPLMVPGATVVNVNPYLVAGSTYTPKVQYLDGLGGLGPQGTGSAFAVPGGFTGPSGTLIPVLSILQGGPRPPPPSTAGLPTGVELGVAHDPADTFTLQVDTSSGFPSPVTVASNHASYVIRHLVPMDGVVRYYRAKATRLGAQDSGWSQTVSAEPTWLVTNPPGPNPGVPTGPTLVVTPKANWDEDAGPPAADPNKFTIWWYGDNVRRDINRTGTWTDVNDGTAAAPEHVVVTRNGVGGSALEYAFQAFKNGIYITNSVTVPPLDDPGVNTVTPNLDVTVTGQSATTVTVQVTFSNPSGGTAPTCTLAYNNCTGDIGAGSISTGTTIVVDRPAYNPGAVSSIYLKATISGGGSETILHTIPQQIQSGTSPTRTKNGSFEAGVAYWATTDAAKWSVETSAPLVGAKSLKLGPVNGSAGVTVYQVLDATDDTARVRATPADMTYAYIPVAPGDRVIVRARIKPSNTAAVVSLGVNTYGNLAGSGETVQTIVDLSGTTADTVVSGDFTIPAGVFAVVPWCSLALSASAYTALVDSFDLVVQSPGSPTTATVLNGDFERKLAHWAVWPSGYESKVSLETASPLAGTYSLKLTADSGTGVEVYNRADPSARDVVADWVQSGTNQADQDAGNQFIPVTVGDRVTVEATGKVSNTAAVGTVRVMAFRADKTRIATTDLLQWTGTGSTTTSTKVADHLCGTGTAFVVILLNIATNATPYVFTVDNVFATVNTSGGSVGKGGGGTGGGPTTLPTGTGTSDGANPRRMMKGFQTGDAAHGASITFPVPYQNIPIMRIRGGIYTQPAAKWGTRAQADAGSGTTSPISTLPQQPFYAPESLTVSGFNLAALLKQRVATLTPKSVTWAAGTYTSVGDSTPAPVTLSASAGDFPALDDLFTVFWDALVTARSNSKGPCTATMQFGIESNTTGTWVRRYTRILSATAESPSSSATNDDAGPTALYIAGVGVSDQFRFVIDAFDVVGFDNGSDFSVDPGYVLYNVATGNDYYTSKTPTGNDVATWEAWDADA